MSWRMLRKPVDRIIKRYRKTERLWLKGDYQRLFWYLVSLMIHGAFMVGLLMAFVVQSDEARKLYWVLTLCQLAGKELNRALKSIFKQQRPPESGKTSNGMPSYHSQHAFFFVSFLVIFHDRILKGSFDRSTTAAVGYSVASFVSYSRLALQVHSVAQVAVGALVGLFQSAVAWALVRALDAL